MVILNGFAICKMFLNGFLKLYLSRWSWGRLVVVREKHDYIWWYPRPPYGATQWHHPAASADSRRASPSGCPRSLPVKVSLATVCGNALETVRAGRCPCLYDWKGESVPNSDFDFRNLLLDHVFQIFFGSRGREKWVERQEELAELNEPGSFSFSKSKFTAKWGTRKFNFEPNWRTKSLISCQKLY